MVRKILNLLKTVNMGKLGKRKTWYIMLFYIQEVVFYNDTSINRTNLSRCVPNSPDI